MKGSYFFFFKFLSADFIHGALTKRSWYKTHFQSYFFSLSPHIDLCVLSSLSPITRDITLVNFKSLWLAITHQVEGVFVLLAL